MILMVNARTVSRFDLIVHDMASHEQLEKLEFAKLWYDLRGELESQDFSKFYDGSHDHVTFGHLMNGYDVGYYSYLW
jgi:metallopeptidase MepB